MQKCHNLTTYFRGRLTFKDVYEMTVGDIQTLSYIIMTEAESKEAKERQQGEVMEDVMNGDL